MQTILGNARLDKARAFEKPAITPSLAKRPAVDRDCGSDGVARCADHRDRIGTLVGDTDLGTIGGNCHTRRPSPTGIVAVTVFAAVSITETVLPPEFEI